MLCLTLGGILGGINRSKIGPEEADMIMAFCMNIPISVYISSFFSHAGYITIYMAIASNIRAMALDSLHICSTCSITLETGKYKTAEYAIGTSLMHWG